MFQNFITSTFRNLAKNKIHSLINIGGLAIGLAVCTMVYLYVEREMNYDSWVKNKESLYMLEISYHNPNWGEGVMSNVQHPLKPVLDESFPEISSSTFMEASNSPLKRDNVNYFEQIVAVHSEFYDLFDLNFIYGDKTTANKDINTIALSEKLAEKYFGKENPLGKTLLMDGTKEMQVGAVYENLPNDTDIFGDAYISYNPVNYDQSWNGASPLLYVQIKNSAEISTIEKKLQSIISERKPFMDANTTNPNEQFTYTLLPFSDVHLVGNGRSASNPYGNLTVIYGYMAIAALILGISCINYVNLSTARATKRIKEVCLRKIMGAERKNLLTQFLSENIIIVLIALSLAISVVEISLPFVNIVINGNLSLDLSDLGLWLLFFGLTAFCTICAGLYPALYISGFRPSKFLHANKSETAAAGITKNGLVVIQFGVATSLIAMATIIYSQMIHVNSMDLGFNKESLVALRGLNNSLIVDNKAALKTEMERITGVQLVSNTYNLPGDNNYTGNDFYLQGSNPDNTIAMRMIPSDPDFLPALEVPLIAGRYLSSDRISDKLKLPKVPNDIALKINVVVNASAVRGLGINSVEEALGKVMITEYGPHALEQTIVGVVNDIYFGASKRGVELTSYFHDQERQSTMMIKLSGNDNAAALKEIDQTWNKMFPSIPVRRLFVDDHLDRLTVRENVQANLFLGFSSIAILISCMGLLGLAMFAAEQRTKEIGIRKVLGAGVRDIVQLLTLQFSKPIILGNVIAIPFAWYFASGWLQGFSQRIDLGPSYFVMASVLALLIGWLTVAGHAYRAAIMNPITALRAE